VTELNSACSFSNVDRRISNPVRGFRGVKFSDESRTTAFRILKLYEDKRVAFIRGIVKRKI
jgi:hypothetical protein